MWIKSFIKLACENRLFFIFCSHSVNINVFVKKLRKRLKLLPVCGLIPQNQKSFLELTVGKLIYGNRVLLVAVIML